MMNISTRFALIAATLLVVFGTVTPSRAAVRKLKLLIIDGQNNHNWKATTPILKSFLEKTKRFTVTVATSPPKKAPEGAWEQFRPDFARYDAVLSNYNGELWPTAVQRSLEEFVSKGGGLVIVHAANNAFPKWDEWNKMIGLGWRNAGYGRRITLDDNSKPVIIEKGKGPGAGHGRQHAFALVVRDRVHPVMKGMPPEWMHFKDELYHGQRGPAADVHLLATAYSHPKTGGTGDHEPIIWSIPYGKGLVFTTVMGHADYSMKCVGFQTVVARSAEWAAGEEVTIPIPKNFPTAEKTSVVDDKKQVRSEGLKVSIQVDLGNDIGQNFGTLFEAVDDKGRVVAGAGFVGVYNTESRSDRRKLHFYAKPVRSKDKPEQFQMQRLPRPNNNVGVYLHEFDKRVFARSRSGGKDGTLKFWDTARRQWRIDNATVPFSIHVGDGVLSVTSRFVAYKGRRIVELGEGEGRIDANYYANGFFVFRRVNSKTSPALNQLVACRWISDGVSDINLQSGIILKLRTPGEFVYAYGQLEEHILAATNTGGVYSFDGKDWRVWLEPDVNVSFQIYSMINFEDRLLMGQYPTGNLFEFDGRKLTLLKNQPPTMKGVRSSAREAQTLTIYGGELYAGVWPWGEVWRYDRHHKSWKFVSRMFTHPEPTTATTHPYENETRRLGSVLNRWGQRVTSMIPFDDSLYISTSAKGSAPYEPKFQFLSGGKWKEYGSVYRYTLPGCLAVQTDWKDGPTRFELTVSKNGMHIDQDGRKLGEVRFDASPAKGLSVKKIVWGRGVFGRFRGKINEHKATGLAL